MSEQPAFPSMAADIAKAATEAAEKKLKRKLEIISRIVRDLESRLEGMLGYMSREEYEELCSFFPGKEESLDYERLCEEIFV